MKNSPHQLAGAFPLAIAILLTACQPYTPRLIDPQVTAADLNKRTLDSPQLKQALISAGDLPNKSWPPSPWKLREIQGAAVFYNPDIAVARAQAKSADAAITTADTALNPSISFLPELAANPGAGVTPWVAGFNLDFTIETAGKRQERTSTARALANAAALRVADSVWSTISGARSALLDLEYASQRHTLLDTQYKDENELVLMAKAKVDAGEAPHTELAIYRIQLNRTALDLADSQGRTDEAMAKLAAAVGIPSSAVRDTPVTFGPLDQFPALPSESSLRRAALLRRSDILAALEDYASTDAALRLEIAKQYPDVHLTPGYTFDQGTSKWALGIGISLPLDRNLGPIREAIARREEAAAVFERLQISVRGELDQALSAYHSDLSRLEEVKDLVAQQIDQLNDARELSKKGEGDQFTVISAQSLVTQAELGRIDALVQAQRSLGRLESSTRLILK